MVGRVGGIEAEPAPQLGVDGVVGEEGGGRLAGEGGEAPDGRAVRGDGEDAAVTLGLGDQGVPDSGRDGTWQMGLAGGLAAVEHGCEGQVGGVGWGGRGVWHEPADRMLGIGRGGLEVERGALGEGTQAGALDGRAEREVQVAAGRIADGQGALGRPADGDPCRPSAG